MPELRQNAITRDWVVIASERVRRPDEFARKEGEPTILPHYSAECPFCAGNESRAMPETFAIREGNKWKVRVVPNKFPALEPHGDRIRKVDGVYRSMTAVGVHEVVIEHPRHDLTTALMKPREVADVLRTYRQRYADIRKDQRVEAIIIFKNHGEGAGTSLQHPHSQIAATPIVPNQFRVRMEEAIRYFDDMGECVFCRTLKDELAASDRIIYETAHFVAFVPYAALSPFHTWIFPRRHTCSFDEITDAEIDDLGRNLRAVLAKLYVGLNNPDFNYSIRSIPTRDVRSEYFHWYVSIIPRVSKTAGFELGSGMFINTTVPEESAEFLRAITTPE
jgi:UDPglucose--hexose-1-phosphate uridylyltransferase